MQELKIMANAIRALTVDAVNNANSGHPGMPLGMADVATVLFAKFLKFDPRNPDWPDRDRFVLSAGHGSMLLYSILYLTGYQDFDIDQIKKFRQLGSKTAGHPEYGLAKGIENTSGPLGQGIGMGVGMALAERILNARFGNNVFNHYTYIIAGDGCLMEGISHEAASFAGHLKLDKIILIFDDNSISIDGPTSLTTSDNHLQRFESYGWHTQSIDGHDLEQIEDAIRSAQNSNKPSIISAKTIIGKYTQNAGTEKSHSGALTKKDIELFRQRIDWPNKDFYVPENILNKWRSLSKTDLYNQWNDNIQNQDDEFKNTFNKALDLNSRNDLEKILDKLKHNAKTESITQEATRKSCGRIIEFLTKEVKELVGGSCDLTGSNNTKSTNSEAITANDYRGNYIYYGVREHFMAACMNGMALHKGVIPYGGTFFVFTDYMRPAIRMSAIMGLQVIYIMTHDSIGVGEDGPTHQPVEHLTSLRVIPNLNVFRPCDYIETIECWQQALKCKDKPSVIVLSRQNIKFIQRSVPKENLCSEGMYIIKDNINPLKVLLVSTGSEVDICHQAQEQMESDGIGVRLVSAPCLDLLNDNNYQKHIDNFANADSIVCVVEAGSSSLWPCYKRRRIAFCIDKFGSSGKSDQVYNSCGITPANISNSCKKLLAQER